MTPNERMRRWKLIEPLLDEGFSYHEIGAAVKLTYSEVREVARYFGASSKWREYRRDLTEKWDEEIREGVAKGWSDAKIASPLGINPKTVQRARKRMGLDTAHGAYHRWMQPTVQARARELISRGFSNANVAKACGIGLAAAERIRVLHRRERRRDEARRQRASRLVINAVAE